MTRRNVNRAPPYVYPAQNGMNQEVMRSTVASPATTDASEEPRATQRGWKSINSQYCVVCKEGGNILCCDNCPASFHLMCHEPIISPDDIPEGNWLCNRCTQTPEVLRIPKDSIDSNVDVDDYELKRNLEVARSILALPHNMAKPLHLFVAAAGAQNATLFELPSEYDIDQIVMAGDTRPPRPEIKDEVCDFCRATNSCPMVQCDFCGNIYHLDCVEPPLIGVPKKRWMCPSHVEHLVDQKLAKSVSIVKRRELYKRFCRQNLNEPEIIGTFLKKIKKRKAQIGPDCEHAELMDVPPFVKCLYVQKTQLPSYPDDDEREIILCDDATPELSNQTMNSLHHQTPHTSVSTSQASQSSDSNSLPENEKVEMSPSNSIASGMAGPSSEVFADGSKNIISIVKDGSVLDEKESIDGDNDRRRNENRNVVGNPGRSDKPLLIRGFCQRGFNKNKSILAVLKAEGYAHPFAIQKAVTSIGVSRNCDICVVEILLSVCTKLLPIHATIVFDKVVRRFELLPTHGAQVVVDGITYGNAKDSHYVPCRCRVLTELGASQSAPLRHGSNISVGCLNLVFASYY